MTQTSAVGLNSNEKGVEATCFLYKREILTAKSERIDTPRCVQAVIWDQKEKNHLGIKTDQKRNQPIKQ